MYAEFFGMRGPAFQLSPDPRFFYPSQVHARALAYLQYGLHQSDGFIVITGEVGAGKTMLAQHLLSRMDRDSYLTANIVSTQLGHDELLRMVASALNIPHAGLDKVSVLRDIEALLLHRHRAGQRCLLLVDEAQNLGRMALEELRMLSNLQAGGVPLVQSFLLGQPQLRKTLGSDDLRQLRDRVIASYHLGPMTKAETAKYIMHRLRLVGWNSNPEIQDEAMTEIHHRTEGIPRRINNLCTRLLIFAFLEKRRHLDVESVRTVIEDMSEEAAVFTPPPAVAAEAEVSNGSPSRIGAAPPERNSPLGSRLEAIRLRREADTVNQALRIYQSRVAPDDAVVKNLRLLAEDLRKFQ